MTKNSNYPSRTGTPFKTDHSQMRTTTCKNEALPSRRSKHPMGTRWLPSSDDRNNNFSRILEEQMLVATVESQFFVSHQEGSMAGHVCVNRVY
jgi:hypothetical protein